jgi:hypothetical protein
MHIVEYRPGDEVEICPREDDAASFVSAHPPLARGEPSTWKNDDVWDVDRRETTTPEIWAWRHRTFVGRTPCAFVAREGDVMLGHAAALPTSLIVGDRVYRAAQLFFDAHVEREAFLALHLALFEQLRAEGTEIVYAIASEEDMPAYQSLELAPLFEVHARNLYLGLNAVSSRLDQQALRIVRRIAREARRIRTKLIEVSIDDLALSQAARLFVKSREHETPDLAIEKSEAWLRWRYVSRPRSDARMLVLRRRAGAGIDAFAIVRTFEIEPGRSVIQLLDHATKKPGRRAMAWLLGEVAMWGLVEKADVLQGYAAAGSELDQALVGSGCIRKKRERVFLGKWIGRSPNPFVAPFSTRHVDLHSGDVEF